MAHFKVPVKLIGTDSNAFAIMGLVSRALKQSGQPEAAKEYLERATTGDYDHLLQVTLEYVDEADEDAGHKRFERGDPAGDVITFTVDGRLVIADPCYIDKNDVLEDLGDLGVILDHCEGEWNAAITVSDQRVSTLRAVKKGARAATAWTHIGDNGVDSGQMFVGCVGSFPLDYDKLLECYKLPDGSWNNDLQVFPFAAGVVSGTGYGDGCYGVYVQRDEIGYPVAVEVRYMEDNLGDGEGEYQDDEDQDE